MSKIPFKDYASKFSEIKLWSKLKKYANAAGQKTVYSVLLMWFAFKRKDTPQWAKNIIFGSLGYFLSPIDGIPDLTPFFGYTDDLGVLSFGLVTISCYINEEVRTNARGKLRKWFGEIDEAELAAIDEQL